jgi:23S rRNA (adenine2030-N6)-methyltransferase
MFPPVTPRAMVLIDPAYEQKQEYQWVAKAVRQTLKIWQKAVMLIWYPLLPANHHLRMIDQLKRDGVDHIFRSEITVKAPEGERGMYGSGMLVINPPYQLAKGGALWLDELATAIAPKGKSSVNYYSSDPV